MKKLPFIIAVFLFVWESTASLVASEVEEFQKLIQKDANTTKETVTSPPLNVLQESEGKILRWKLKPSDNLEIKKDSDQYILLNGRKIHRQVFHRVLLAVEDISSINGFRLSGTFSSRFRYFLKTKTPYQEEEQFFSRFYLKPRGEMVLDRQTYMPNIRHMPNFPKDADPAIKDSMAEGFRWNAPGEEVMQVGKSLLHIPLDVIYEYHGKEIVMIENMPKTMHKIFMNYPIDYKRNTSAAGELQSIYGFASVHMLWNEQEGIPHRASEVYDVMLRYGDGQYHEFRIKSTSQYRKIKPMTMQDKLVLKKDLEQKLQRYKEEKANTNVQVSRKGVSIQLQNILFDYDSTTLTEKSKRVLRELIPVLEKYPNRYFVIQGHTDNVGSVDYNLKLSQERAKAVASFLMDNSKLPAENFSFQGFGLHQPIAGNHTEEGRAKNRRVEIFIPEK